MKYFGSCIYYTSLGYTQSSSTNTQLVPAGATRQTSIQWRLLENKIREHSIHLLNLASQHIDRITD
jgi:hypothetical protein